MIFLNNKDLLNKKDLIGSPNKTLNKENLFDFVKNRVKISLCEWKICFKTIIWSNVFLTD